MSTVIGALRVTLGADSAKFESGMKRAQAQAASSAAGINKSLASMKSGLSGFAAALSVGLISQGIKAALDYAGSLGEVAAQLGVTSKELQTFRYSVQQNGGTLEQADAALGKLSLNMSKALSGSKAATKAFDGFGVSLDDLKTKSKTQIIGQIADQMVKTGGASKNAAGGVALFGKQFQTIVPTLDLGSAGMNQLAMAAEELGIVLSDSQIQQADETADKLDAVRTVLAAQIAGVVADNASSILTLASALGQLTSSIIDFLGSNPTAALALLGGLAGGRFGPMGALVGAAAGGIAGARAKMASEDANPDLAFRAKRLREARSQYTAAKRGRGLQNAIGGGRGGGTNVKSAAAALRKEIDLTLVARLADARRKQRGPATADVSQFLAPPPKGGGSPKKKTGGADNSARDAERAAEEARRNAFQFDQDSRRADMDILRAKQSLATDYIDRTALSIQMLDLERASFEAGLQNDIASGDLSQANAAILRAKNDVKDGLERQAVIADEEVERQREYEALEQKTFSVSQGILEKRAGLAETVSERRAVELEILRLAYEEKRRMLQNIIDTSKNRQEQEEARRELAGLGTNEKLDREGVMNSTRGPLEEYMKTLPDSAAKMNEALEGVAAGGLQSIQDGILGVITGAKSMGDAFKDIANQIIADLIRIMIQKAVVGALGNALGGAFGGGGLSSSTLTGSGSVALTSLPKFASGGGFNILGRKGTDHNIMSLNGLPIARVSYGERVNISNDNANASGGMRVQVVKGDLFDVIIDQRASAVSAPMATRAAMAGASGGHQATLQQQRRSIP